MRVRRRNPLPARGTPILLIGALWLAAVGTNVVAAEETWTNRLGQEMEAEVLGYDLESREVLFAHGPNGDPMRYPLRDLDAPSRLRAVFSKNSLASLSEAGWRPDTTFFLQVGAIWILCLFALAGLSSFGGFWAAARLVSGEAGFFHHLSGFLKYVFANSFLALVAYTLIILSVMLQFSNTPGTEGPPGFDLSLIRPRNGSLIAFQLITWVFLTFVIDLHYQIGWFRALFVQFLSNVLGFLFSLLLIGGGAALLMYYLNQPDLVDHAVNAWFLEPLGLL